MDCKRLNPSAGRNGVWEILDDYDPLEIIKTRTGAGMELTRKLVLKTHEESTRKRSFEERGRPGDPETVQASSAEN